MSPIIRLRIIQAPITQTHTIPWKIFCTAKMQISCLRTRPKNNHHGRWAIQVPKIWIQSRQINAYGTMMVTNHDNNKSDTACDSSKWHRDDGDELSSRIRKRKRKNLCAIVLWSKQTNDFHNDRFGAKWYWPLEDKLRMRSNARASCEKKKLKDELRTILFFRMFLVFFSSRFITGRKNNTCRQTIDDASTAPAVAVVVVAVHKLSASGIYMCSWRLARPTRTFRWPGCSAAHDGILSTGDFHLKGEHGQLIRHISRIASSGERSAFWSIKLTLSSRNQNQLCDFSVILKELFRKYCASLFLLWLFALFVRI